MLELLQWLESSALGEGLRNAGVWTYAIINLVHILGIATLIGSVFVLDLRLLGLWPDIPLVTITRPTVPVAACGFVLAIVSGIAMLSFNATEYHGNPFMFRVKFPALGVAMLNVIAVGCLPAWRQRHRREPAGSRKFQLALGGAISLLAWLGVLGGGRMIGYW